jgi:hypothetical protein
MLRRPDRDSLNSEALQTLDVGQAYVMTPAQKSGVFVQIPPEPFGNLPKLPTTIADLKRRSKANFGAMERPQESSAVEQDIFTEPEADPQDTPPAPQPTAKTETPKKAPPKPTSRRRRDRFDDDVGEPEIEIH